MRLLIIGLMLYLLCIPSLATTHTQYGDALTLQVIQNYLVLDSKNITTATLNKQADYNYSLELTLTPAAAAQLTKMSVAGVDKIMNVVFERRIISIAVIQSSLGAKFELTGFSQAEAQAFIKKFIATKKIQ